MIGFRTCFTAAEKNPDRELKRVYKGGAVKRLVVEWQPYGVDNSENIWPPSELHTTTRPLALTFTGGTRTSGPSLTSWTLKHSSHRRWREIKTGSVYLVMLKSGNHQRHKCSHQPSKNFCNLIELSFHILDMLSMLDRTGLRRRDMTRKSPYKVCNIQDAAPRGTDLHFNESFVLFLPAN